MVYNWQFQYWLISRTVRPEADLKENSHLQTPAYLLLKTGYDRCLQSSFHGSSHATKENRRKQGQNKTYFCFFPLQFYTKETKGCNLQNFNIQTEQRLEWSLLQLIKQVRVWALLSSVKTEDLQRSRHSVLNAYSLSKLQLAFIFSALTFSNYDERN